MSADVATLLTAGRYYVTRRWPDFDAIQSLALMPHPGLGTMGLTDAGTILYDPAVVAKQTVPQVAADLLHELFHFLRGHAARRGDRDAKDWNFAADAESNDDLAACGCDLSFVQFVQAEHFGCARGLTAEMYYEAIRNGGRPRQSKNKPCGGGSGAGNPLPDEPKQGPFAQQPLLQELVRHRTAEKIAKSGGRYGADWDRWADEQLRPPVVSWRSKLGAGLRGAFAARPGASQRTYAVQSRKQAGVGRPGAGVPVLRGRGATLPEVAFVLDTSGSMGAAEINAALSEVQGLVHAVGGKLRYLSADARVCGEADIRNANDARRATRGGGGTDFRPAFDALAASAVRPEVVVYATDGCGTAPAVAPSWCRTIWLLMPGGRRPAEWGTVITMESDDGKR